VLILQAAVLTALVLRDPPRVQVAAAISLLLPPGILALSFGLAILQGQRRFTSFNVLRILPSTAYVAGVVAVFALNEANLVRLMTLWAVVNLVGGFLALALAVRGLPKHTGADEAPSRLQMAKFGLKALLGTLSPVEVVRLDQAVVGLFLNPAALGLYVVAQAFTNLPRVLAASIGVVTYPHVAAELDRDAARRAMWKFFFVGLALSAAVVGALEFVTGTLVTLLFGSDFNGATPIAQILLIATFFMASRRILTDGVNGIGKPGLGTIAEIASWVLLIPGMAILLPLFGAEGVALALAISWAASLLLLVVLAAGAGRTSLSKRRPLAGQMSRLANGKYRARARQAIQIAGIVLLALLAGLAAAFLPRVALASVIALSAGLFFAFGRRALAQHAQSRLPRAVRARASLLRDDESFDDAPDARFGVPRRLYYGGVLLLSLLTLRAGGQVTFSDLLFLVSFLLACAEFVILRRSVPMKLPFLLLIGIAVFSLGGLLSTFDSYQALKSVAVVARLIFLTVFWFWLGTVTLRRRTHVMTAISFWVASAAICGGGAILQLADVIPGASGGRASGLTTNANDLGGLTAIAFVPALMLAVRPRIAPATRASSYLLLLLIAAGLILSGSIGALLAAGAAFFVWLAFQRMSIHSMLVFGTLATCIVAVTSLQAIRGVPSPLDRLNTVTSNSSLPGGGTQLGSVDQRISTYRVAVARIKEDPFVGVGLDLASVTRPFGVENYEYDVHNLVIGLWYKAGLLGLGGMLLALLAILRSGWRAIFESASDSEWRVAVALASSVVAFLVFAMSEPVLFSRFGWIPAALVLALRAVQQQEAASVELGSQEQESPRTVLATLRA
jgi:O-antigen ligase